ncbi:GntR family transcriptional regulator [Streptomyces asiaticus]
MPEVLTALREQVMYGGIAPDSRINSDAVARDLGVSTTPVREAPQRLEGDNLVVYTPGRGYSNAPLLDLAGPRSLYEYRLLVEPWAARYVATDVLLNPADELRREFAESADRFRHRRAGRGRRRRGDDRAHHELVQAVREHAP